MLQILFEWLEFAFECFQIQIRSIRKGFKAFESYWKHSNANSSHSKEIRSIQMQIRTIRKGFEAFEWNSSHSKGIQCLYPFRMARISLECFETLFNGSNLHWNASNPFRMARICIRMLPITFECFEFAFECLESLSNASNLNLNASNPFRMVRICIWMLWIPFE